jgi:aminoglycoside 2'-N-acetyltransferase I
LSGTPIRLRRASTPELGGTELAAIRRLMDEAFAGDEHGGFDDDDWQHALGGLHFVAQLGNEIVAHASVVEREIRAGGIPLRTGYVEAVATDPRRQRQGIGTAVMRGVNAHVTQGFQLGALGTGSHGFYERLGWMVWLGPSSVRAPEGERRTPDEDGYIMVLATPASPPLDRTAPISCDWRRGDVW